jgi:hypothetical protein
LAAILSVVASAQVAAPSTSKGERTMREAATCRTVDIPLRRKRAALSGQTRFLIGLGVAVGVFILWGRANLAGG